MSYSFVVANGDPINLDDVANHLRELISTLPPGSPLLGKEKLAGQAGVAEFLVVVRSNENPHTHPESDLIFSVLEGGGYVQLFSAGVTDAPAGTTVVVPKGMCHAYYNTSPTDSVLLATFSPAIPDQGQCEPDTHPSKHARPRRRRE